MSVLCIIVAILCFLIVVLGGFGWVFETPLAVGPLFGWTGLGLGFFAAAHIAP